MRTVEPPDDGAPSLRVLDRKWASDLQHALDDFLYEIYDVLDDVPDGPEDDRSVSVPGYGEPFCGCSSCEDRTVVVFLAPRIVKGFLDGKIDVVY